jgi:hypothetical protein
MPPLPIRLRSMVLNSVHVQIYLFISIPTNVRKTSERGFTPNCLTRLEAVSRHSECRISSGRQVARINPAA